MKKILFILSFVVLSSCGFRPMFSGQDTDIYVPPISGINGIELRNALWAKFGGQKEQGAKYTLTVNLNDPVTRYKALELSGGATWQEVSLSVSYTLSADGKNIASGREQVSESYPFVQYMVASNASYNSAVQNAINVLAEKISARAIAETYRYTHLDSKK